MNVKPVKRVVSWFFSLLFVKTYYYRFWETVNNLSLKGMGIGNGATQISSGEKIMLHNVFTKYNVRIVFDVGANEGNYSRHIKENFPDTSIYAFEPHPKTYEVLKKTLHRYKDIRSFNVAIGNPVEQEVNKIKLYDYSKNDGSDHASVLQDSFLYSHNTGDIVFHEVEMISLDQFCTQHQVAEIDFLKIDTEGFEYEAIKGLKRMLALRKVKMIQWEFNSMNAGRVFFLDFWKALNPDFEIYRLFPNGLRKIKMYNPKFLEIFHLQNYIAIRKDV